MDRLNKLFTYLSMLVLPLMASFFAVPLCTGKLYEVELPEKLREKED